MIYLDNSATTYPKPNQVYEALDYANRHYAFNAGRGTYDVSKQVLNMINETRSKIASFVNSKGNQVVFTSSATESLNMIINGLPFEDGDYIFISPFEHNAIVRPLFNIKNKININVELLPFNKTTWEPDVKKIEEIFSFKKPKAVFISHISNVTGKIISFDEIFALAKKYNAVTVLDCAQSFGIVNPNINNCDFCVFAGHKSLYASFGVAGFIFSEYLKLNITKSGGNGSDSLNHSMPENGYERYESGSPNSVAIYGLNKSCDWLKDNDVFAKEKHLMNYLLTNIKTINNKITLYTPEDESIFGILSFNIDGYSSNDVADILNEEFGIQVRSGYHCAPFIHEFLDTIKFSGTVRVSIGAFNTTEDIDALLNALKTF